ncbi:metallophosphoesterase [Alkalicoccus urumqiensis]|uniref:Phosphoesterase n=1 Tax=Alkalicoccus urumqiensis TaxID=1548213 RepID=A0A2P6MLE1_ALKUR|nr:metallophosphoesterase [Alkalicoccus urumqiensis]PRO67107.1 phosphoesterase [Alkalicoccus urumqiensis]
MRKRWWFLLSLVLLTAGGILALPSWLEWQNNGLMHTRHTIASDALPEAFEGYRIVHLSDLHNHTFGENQEDLVSRTASEDPDIIVFTGDLEDEDYGGSDQGLVLMERLTAIAPVYMISGNHEWRFGGWDDLEQKINERGVTTLRNDTVELTQAGETIRMSGIEDPLSSIPADEAVRSSISDPPFHLLLAHRPEDIASYAEWGADVVFTGHAHGGQIRIPFIGGLNAPGQGWMPEYTSGIHTEGVTQMVISRGLGNSTFPQRIFNRPEIITVTLQSE